MHPRWARLGAISLMIGALASTTAHGADAAPGPLKGTALERHLVTDESGRRITYYLGGPAQGTAPIMLMIQGSGCLPTLFEQPNGFASSVFNLLPFAHERRFVLLAVEKPFADTQIGRNPGSAQFCSQEFKEDFTAQSWLRALQAAIRDARRSPAVDPQRMFVFGHSEGAVMAAMLAARDPGITDVAVLGGSGSTQLFDFVIQAYRSCFDVAACLGQIDATRKGIARDPDNATELAWGHPYKRWTSFFRIDPAEELLRSRARIYIALGTADTAVPALSQELAVAKLQAMGREVTVRRVPDADHGFNRQGAGGGTNAEYRAALDWFWNAK